MGRISPESWQRSGRTAVRNRRKEYRTGQAAAKPGGSAARFRLETRAAKLPLPAVAGSEQPGPDGLRRSPPLHPAWLAEVEGLRRRRVAEEGVASGTPVAGDPGRQDQERPSASSSTIPDKRPPLHAARTGRPVQLVVRQRDAPPTPPWRGSNDSSVGAEPAIGAAQVPLRDKRRPTSSKLSRLCSQRNRRRPALSPPGLEKTALALPTTAAGRYPPPGQRLLPPQLGGSDCGRNRADGKRRRHPQLAPRAGPRRLARPPGGRQHDGQRSARAPQTSEGF